MNELEDNVQSYQVYIQVDLRMDFKNNFIIITHFIYNMNKTNLKTIQNYILTQLKYYSTPLTQFWTAKHKILKKHFLLKKINTNASPCKQTHSRIGLIPKQQWVYRNSMNEINMLKRHNLSNVPKCHKIIKTSNSIYLIYDEFPNLNLDNFLIQTTQTRLEKLQLLLTIATQLEYFHQLSINFITLSTSNIHISGKNQVFFADWSLSRDVHDGRLIVFQYLSQNQQFIAEQVKEKGNYSAASDIFSLGKIFEKIMQTQSKYNSTNEEPKMQELTQKMTKKDPLLRPSLKYIMAMLESLKTNEWSTTLNKTLTKSKSLNMTNFALVKEVCSPSKNSTRTNSEQHEKLKRKKQVPVLSQKYGLKPTISTVVSSAYKQNSNKEDVQLKIKQICKQRNLAFFILSLTQFIIKMQKCVELAYILVKYARITINSIIDQLTQDSYLDNKLERVLLILKEEQSNIINSQLLLKNSINFLKCGQAFKNQPKQQNVINTRLLKGKIVEFAKQMVIVCEHQSNAKVDQKKISQNLFYTLLILKNIEFGSYQRYWESHYQIDQINLSRQQLMKQQLRLGMRYLKSKIAQILSRKGK